MSGRQPLAPTTGMLRPAHERHPRAARRSGSSSRRVPSRRCTALQPGQIQPSSIDLRLGARIWQLQVSFLPGARGVDRKLGRLATGVSAHRSRRAARAPPRLRVPRRDRRGARAPRRRVGPRRIPRARPGRLDVFVRLLTEQGHAFDTVPRRLPRAALPGDHAAVVPRRRAPRRSALSAAPRARPAWPRRSTRSAMRQARDPMCTWSDGTPAPVDDDAAGRAPVGRSAGRGRGPVGYLARRHQPPVDLRGAIWRSIATGSRSSPRARKGRCSSPSSSTSSRRASACASRPTCAPSWSRSTRPRASCAPTTRGSSTRASAGRRATRRRARGSCSRSARTTSRSCSSTGSRCSGSSS